MKRITTILFSIIAIFSIVYYTVKFYMNDVLIFNNRNILGWTILVFIILATLIIGLWNSSRLNTITRQNVELLTLVHKLIDDQFESRDDILTTLLNSREIELDIFNKLKRGN